MTWSRRQFVWTSSMAAAGGVLRGLPVLGQQPAAPPTVTRFELVRNKVGLFTGRGGTIGWLILPEGVVVVDSQFPDTAKACLDGLKERTTAPIEALINTHHHADHTGGNAVLRPAAKKIVAHARVPELQKKQAEQAAQGGTATPQAYPDTTFNDTWSMSIGSYKLSAKHYGPGHTGGDIVVFFEPDDVVHMGDLAFNHRHPFVDRAAGASVRGWLTSLEKVTAEHTATATYIFGHAREDLSVKAGKAELLAFRDYFSAVLDHVQKGITAGRSKEEITKLEKLPKFEDYAEAPPRLTLAGVLGVAFDELTNRS